VTKLYGVLYERHLLVLTPFVVRLCILIYSVSCIIHTYVMHACGDKGHIQFIYACGFKTVFKQVMINGITDSSKML